MISWMFIRASGLLPIARFMLGLMDPIVDLPQAPLREATPGVLHSHGSLEFVTGQMMSVRCTSGRRRWCWHWLFKRGSGLRKFWPELHEIEAEKMGSICSNLAAMGVARWGKNVSEARGIYRIS